MSTITLPNIRVGSDLQVRVRLKDDGVAIDWSTLQNIKACIYSDAQRALAGRCGFSIDEEDSTLLVCTYAANKPQYLGVNRIVISAKYMGETKTYDKPAFTFVRWTADQEGEEITIDDPDVDVEIEVDDVSSSLLDQAIAAALQAAADAEHAAHLIPNQVLLDCEQATADANAAAEAANAAGITSVQVSVEDNEPGTPSADVSLVNKVLSIIFHYLKGNTGEAAGFGAITATVDDVVGDPSVTVTASGPDTAKVLAFAFHGLRGIQGVPGVANAKYKQVDTLPTASADTMDFIYLTPSGTTGVYNMSYTEQDGSTYSWQDLGTTAIQLSDYATKAEVSQLEAKVTDLTDPDYEGTGTREVEKADYLNGSTKTVNGVSIVCNADGTFSLSGTATSGGGKGTKLTNLFPLPAGNYVLRMTIIEDGSFPSFYLINGDGSLTALQLFSKSEDKYVTIDEDITAYIGANVANGSTYSGKRKLEVLLEETYTKKTAEDDVARQGLAASASKIQILESTADLMQGRNVSVLYDGHIDGSGKIVNYGSAKLIAIPICGGDNIAFGAFSNQGSACAVVKSFDFNFQVPYTIDYATGESIRDIPSNLSFVAPGDAKYLLVRAYNNSGTLILPSVILVNGSPIRASFLATLYNRAKAAGATGVRLNNTILASNVITTGDNWTIEILFKAPNLVNYQDLVSYHGYYVQLNAAGAVKIEGNTTVMDKFVNRNNPVHIVFSHDSENKCSVWLNGEKVTDAATHAKYNTQYYNQNFIKLGLMRSGRGNNGVSVFHLRLFSSAIGDADAAALWNNGKPDKYNITDFTGILAQYKGMAYPFAWLDSSGNNNHLFPNEDFVPTFDEPYEDEEHIRGDEVLVPIKANKIWRNGRFWQGACLVGDKVVGFGSSEDDHSNNGSYFVYNPNDLMEYLSQAYHNIGHCNSVDYNPDTDCIITTSSATKQITTHSPVIHLVGNASAKVNNGQSIYYDADDVVNIELSGINGLYTGVSIFGETSDIAYLVTIEDPDHYDGYKGRWLYRVMLGKGDNDLTTLFPSNSFGTFVSGKSATEYNGTAHIDAVFPFESRMELQGGKYINGAIVFSTDIYLTTERILQSYLVKMEIDAQLKNCKITEMLWIPTRSNAGTLQRTESEECVIIGNRVLHQVIIHGDTNYYQIHDYQLP